MQSTTPLTAEDFETALERVENFVLNELKLAPDNDELWTQTRKTIADVATNTFQPGVTLDAWEDHILLRLQPLNR